MAATAQVTLYNATTPTGALTTYTTATSSGNIGRGYETLQNPWKNFLVTLVATYSAGTSLDVTLQHSPDGTNWLDVVSFTQVTTTNSAQCKAVTSSTIPNLLPFVRAKSVTVGASASYVVLVQLWYEDVKH